MEQMSDKFRWEVKEVKRIRNAVRRRQHRIAQANLRACCAIMIQATWRRYQAKLLAWARRGLKLGQILMRWWRRSMHGQQQQSRALFRRFPLTLPCETSCRATFPSTGFNFKVRQSLAIVKRFVSNNVQRRRQLKYEKQMSSTRVQRAWRRWMLRVSLRRMVLATAATEGVIENVLVDLARQVYLEIKGAVIARAWKQSRRRFGNKSRKGKNGRVFVTQGGGSSPRRKPARAGGSRTGVTSDPSSAYPSRRSPSAAPSSRGGNRGKNSVAVASPPPAFLGVVAAATTSTTTSAGAAAVAAGGTGGDANEERRGSSQSSNISPSSRQKTVSSPEDGSALNPRSRRVHSSASATTEEETLRDGGAGGSKVPDSSSTSQPPFEAVPGVESPKSEMSGSSYGGGDGGRDVLGRVDDDAAGAVEGSVVDGGATLNEESKESANATVTVAAAAVAVVACSEKAAIHPRRPSGEKPSKLSEGRRSYSRPHAIQVGGRSRLHSSGADGGSKTATATKEVVASALTTSSAESNNCDPLAPGDATTAVGCVAAALGAAGATDTETRPAAAGLGKREVNFEQMVRLGGDDHGDDDGDRDNDNDDDDDDGGDANKIPAAVGPDELDEGSKKSKLEEYGSDVFESDGELSLTR
ncbi:unnamed protein product [Ectocarpus fasciculatus]